MPPTEDKREAAPERDDDRYHGFSLKSVCWGYRDIFERTIEGLFEQGLIGEDREEVTAKFFELLKNADQSCFDHFLRNFLGALNPGTRWLLDLPEIFRDVVDTGRELAECRLHHGIRFFEMLGAGDLGQSPEQLRNLLKVANRLRGVDEDLAMAFMKGYRTLVERLRPDEIDRYVNAGLEIFSRNTGNGLAFMETTLRSSETYIQSITRECRLCDIQPMLQGILKALTGTAVEAGSLSELDSDDLMERGSSVVCMYKWLYLPERIREFSHESQNRSWYMLCTLVAAGMLAENSFCRVHGYPGYQTCRDLTGNDLIRVNLFQVVELVRVLRRIRTRWPGARNLVEFGLKTELDRRPAETDPDRLLFAAMFEADSTPAVRIIRARADESVNFFHTLSMLDGSWTQELTDEYPDLGGCPLRSLTFMPDFLFPAAIETAPPESLVANLKQEARNKDKSGRDSSGASGRSAARGSDGDDITEDGEIDSDAVPACFLYDEWSEDESDYYRDYCQLHEEVVEPHADLSPSEDIMEEARRVRQAFERFKPDVARREKFLPDGEVINQDLLIDYLVRRNREPEPRVDFYENPRIQNRDLAVLILLDVSGSTSNSVGEREKVLDLEKHAALILGQGLDSLGDRFSICGFSSNGRENCDYFIYKQFDDSWSHRVMSRTLSAYPMNSTRIGPALRHSGYRLENIEAKQRLIILITDGKPMDTGYSPESRYAQYDIRTACEENARKGISTFAISTEENSAADMEIMFPGRRFAVLEDIRKLPGLLPGLYLRLTM